MAQRLSRLFRSLEDATGRFGPCALTIGNFDGTHIGHQKIFGRVRDVAAANGWKAGALTFDPHPTRVVAPARAPKLLTTPEQRAATMGQFGIEEVLILPFDRQIASLSPEEFARRMLVEALQVRAVLVGDNFHFGAKQAGNIEVLRRLGDEYGFAVEIVPPVLFRRRMVSSSEVRHAIEAGEVNVAGRLLGRWFALEGEVVSGHGIGSKQTVPTLNLAAESEMLPGRGVYVTRCTDVIGGRTWTAVTNVGYRPTFGGDDQLSIETFLLTALDGETPRRIRLEFLRRLRDEKKFESAGALKEQILTDVRRAQSYHRRVRKWVAAAYCYTGM
jgi:riboflavin kinase / FMN adenylyltransferase